MLATAWDSYKAKAPSSDEEFARGWMKARAEALTKAGLEPVLTEW